MRDRLQRILETKSVIRDREFTLASGRKSRFYVDARMTTLDPDGAYLAARMFLEMLRRYQVDAVGGYAIGADPIVAAISVVSRMEGNPLPAFIIRKEAKAYGTGKAIEGNFPTGGDVAIFDDVVTSGGSILKGAELVKSLGARVAVVMALIDRQEGGREAITEAGYPFAAIFTKSDFGITE